MAARKKDDVSRWLMKNRTQKEEISAGSEEGGGGDSGPKLLKLAEKVLNSENEQRKRQAQMIRSKIQDSQRGEELDFDELFDDDEGNDNFGGLLDDITAEEPSNQQQNPANSNQNSNQKSNYKLSSEGRTVRNIVRHLDKSNDIIYASDDENDPYASDFEEGGEDEDDFDKWTSNNNNVNNVNNANLVPKPKISTGIAQNVSAKSSKPPSMTSSRAVSPIGSPNKAIGSTDGTRASPSIQQAKRNKTSDDEDSLFISEPEIIGYLRQGPISTKDLIAKFKKQLKSDPKNKEIFRELVRKLAMVKPATGSGDEDKLLELKPEFK